MSERGRFWKRKPPDPRTHPCRRWRTIAQDPGDRPQGFIEECVDCGRERARLYRYG